MRELPPTAFTAAEGRAAGWSRSAIRHAVTTGRLCCLRRGVYLRADTCADPAIFALAVARSFGGPIVSHRSALLVHRLPVVGGLPALPEVTVPPRTNANLPGVCLHRASLRPEDVVGEGTVTSVARTLVDVARHHSLFTSVPAIDAALHRKSTTPAAVEDVLEFCSGWTWARRARRAWALADGRAESPLESISRLRLRQLRMPMPEPQKIILNEWGLQAARVDFYWDEFGVFGEADGRSKYQDSNGKWDHDVRWNEKVREEDLGSLGLVAARWGWEHAWSRPQVIRDRVLRAISQAQARQQAGFPRLWSVRESA